MSTTQRSISQKMILAGALICSGLSLQAQTQKGSDIDGEAGSDHFGYSVSMPDANTIAMGAPDNDNSGLDAGLVKVYNFDGTDWSLKGSPLVGEAAEDFFGWSLSMPDANTIAVGARANDGFAAGAGHVRVFRWNGTDWEQKGADIDGEGTGEQAGYSVSMPDSNTVAIGAFHNSEIGNYSGQVRVYQWNGTSWVQKGGDLNGAAAGDEFGYSVSMPDANTLAVGVHYSDANGSNSGLVRVYEWVGNNWNAKGQQIWGETAGDQFGASVSMPDANTIAAGAVYNTATGFAAGHVRVYRWNDIDLQWEKKGLDIDGESAMDVSGYSISMPDSNVVAIGATGNNGGGTSRGHVRVYSWSGTAWVQTGSDIDGEADDDNSGCAVSMPDANTVGIGAWMNDGAGTDAGHARVFAFSAPVSQEPKTAYSISAYPNPTTGELAINLGENVQSGNVTVRNMLGQEVLKQEFSGASELRIELKAEPGVYFVEVFANGAKAVMKVVKQ